MMISSIRAGIIGATLITAPLINDDVRRYVGDELIVSASLISEIAGYEGYSNRTIIPIAGDVHTIGFGRTTGVMPGQITEPVRELQHMIKDVENIYAKAVRKCGGALTRYEFNAYTSLAYNIGTRAFCESTLVKRLKEKKYAKACGEIKR